MNSGIYEYYCVKNDEEYLAHHGVKKQRWGERNGPPYPLDYNKLADEAEQRGLDRNEVISEAKLKAIRRGDLEEVNNNKEYFTEQEVRDVIKRFELNNQLSDLSKEPDKTDLRIAKAEDFIDKAVKVSNVVNKGTTVWDSFARLSNGLGLTKPPLPIIDPNLASSFYKKSEAASSALHKQRIADNQLELNEQNRQKARQEKEKAKQEKIRTKAARRQEREAAHPEIAAQREVRAQAARQREEQRVQAAQQREQQRQQAAEQRRQARAEERERARWQRTVVANNNAYLAALERDRRRAESEQAAQQRAEERERNRINRQHAAAQREFERTFDRNQRELQSSGQQYTQSQQNTPIYTATSAMNEIMTQGQAYVDRVNRI